MQRITRLFIGLLWLCTLFPLVSQAQQADTVRQGQTVQRVDTTRTGRNYSDEKIWRIGKGIYTDTVRRNDFKASAADVVELDDCDTTFQTFLLVRRPSPWRLGLYLGPNFAYCGTWDATFGNDRRDQTLYNGTGINFTANLDYYLTRSTRRLRFGVGTAFGYQNSFTRGAYKQELYDLGDPRPESAIEVKSRPSEDMFLLVGPVITFDFLRSRKNPERTSFIEAGIRGGIFRSEAATITGTVPSENNLLLRSVNPSTKLLHPGALFSLGIFFPLSNYWHIGLQAQGYYTKLNYLIVNGTDVPRGAGPSTLFEFQRKNGGFNVGVGVRKDFRQKKLIPKAPVTCPVCDSIPALAVRFNNASLMGMSLILDSTLTTAGGAGPVISWSSRTLNPKNETFTARLHYKVDSIPSTRDSVIAQLVNTTDTTMAFPSAFIKDGKPSSGFYYVTVHSRQESKCGACMSEVATTSFAFLPPKFKGGTSVSCDYENRLDRLEVFYRTPYTRETANICYCNGVITQVNDPVTRLRYRGLNRRLALEPFVFTNGDGSLNLRELPADLAKLLQDEKRKIESGRAISYKGRRIRPQVSSFRSVFTVVEKPCPANNMKGRTVGSFQVTISDNSYTITDLKPLTEEQRIRLTTPPAPARRGSGRRNVSFDADENKN